MILSVANDLRPRCHPERRLANRTKRLCLECALDLKAARKGIQRLGAIPGPVPGVAQHAFTEPPHACLHCGKTAALILDGRELHCVGVLGGCGWTAYRVSATAPSPRHTNPQRYTAPAVVASLLLLLAGCTIQVPTPPTIAAPIAASCVIDGERRQCVILLQEDYAKIEAALCSGRAGCSLVR